MNAAVAGRARTVSGISVAAVERLVADVVIVSVAIPLPGNVTSWGFTIFPFALALVPGYLLWLGDVSHRSRARTAQPLRVDAVLAALLAVGCLSATAVLVNGGSLRPGFMWMYVAALYGYARYRLPVVSKPDRVLRVLTVVFLVMAVVCVIQFVTVSTFGALAQYFPGGENTNFTVLGVADELKRAQGPFFGPNILVQWLTFPAIWIIAAWRMLSGRIAALALGVAALMLALTFSRGGWLIVPSAAAVLVILLWRRGLVRSRRFLGAAAGVAVAVVAVAALAPAVVFHRFHNDEGSLTERSRSQQAGVAAIAAYPVAGTGYGGFNDVAADLGHPVDLRPHDVFVLIPAENGLPTAAAFVVLVGAMAFRSLRASRRRGQGGGLGAALPVIVGVWVVYLLLYETAADYAVLPVLFLLFGYASAFSAPSTRAVPDRRASP